MFSKMKYLFFIILVLFLNYAIAGDCIEVGQKEPSNWRDGEKEIKITENFSRFSLKFVAIRPFAILSMAKMAILSLLISGLPGIGVPCSAARLL